MPAPVSDDSEELQSSPKRAKALSLESDAGVANSGALCMGDQNISEEGVEKQNKVELSSSHLLSLPVIHFLHTTCSESGPRGLLSATERDARASEYGEAESRPALGLGGVLRLSAATVIFPFSMGFAGGESTCCPTAAALPVHPSLPPPVAGAGSEACDWALINSAADVTGLAVFCFGGLGGCVAGDCCDAGLGFDSFIGGEDCSGRCVACAGGERASVRCALVALPGAIANDSLSKIFFRAVRVCVRARECKPVVKRKKKLRERHRSNLLPLPPPQ